MMAIRFEQWGKKNLAQGRCRSCGKNPVAFRGIRQPLDLCEVCRPPRKIHLEDIGRGEAACGIPTDTEHLAADPDEVTCGNCRNRELHKRLTVALTPKPAGWNSVFSKQESKRMMIQEFGGTCFGCGLTPFFLDGRPDLRHFTVDHIRARNSANGVSGGDELENLLLLCRHCNEAKGNSKKDPLTIEELRTALRDEGSLHRPFTELPDLYAKLVWSIRKTDCRKAELAAAWDNRKQCECGSDPAIRRGFPVRRCEACLRKQRVKDVRSRVRKELLTEEA